MRNHFPAALAFVLCSVALHGSWTARAASPPAYTKSITPTPRQWTADGYIEVFSRVQGYTKMISILNPLDWWYAEGKDETESVAYQSWIWQRTLMGDLQVSIQIDPYPTRSGPISNLPAHLQAATFADPAVIEAYKADALQRVRLYNATYVCLGIEINSYYMAHPEDMENYIMAFRAVRNAIKAERPDAVVFVSYQYETMMGLQGTPQWELIGRFGDEVDAVGVSTYPLTFNPSLTVRRIPSNYYSRIRSYTSKPIVLAEIGWPSDPAFGGSERSQADFLKLLPTLLKDMPVLMANYNFFYDAIGFGAPFDSMGLIDAKNRVKPAMQYWK